MLSTLSNIGVASAAMLLPPIAPISVRTLILTSTSTQTEEPPAPRRLKALSKPEVWMVLPLSQYPLSEEQAAAAKAPGEIDVCKDDLIQVHGYLDARTAVGYNTRLAKAGPFEPSNGAQVNFPPAPYRAALCTARPPPVFPPRGAARTRSTTTSETTSASWVSRRRACGMRSTCARWKLALLPCTIAVLNSCNVPTGERSGSFNGRRAVVCRLENASCSEGEWMCGEAIHITAEAQS